jgi:hypothetical protein
VGGAKASVAAATFFSAIFEGNFCRIAATTDASGVATCAVVGLLTVVGLGIVVGWTFWPSFIELVELWESDAQYSHGYLVPLFSLVLLWLRRDGCNAEQLRPSWWGMVFVAAGCLVRLAGGHYYFFWLEKVAILPVLFGLTLTLGGWAASERFDHTSTLCLLEKLTGVLGPAAGDRILPALANVLARQARGSDHVARLGPGRFGVLLTETGEVEAVNYVERVRAACELWLESGAIAMRLAIGWAAPPSDGGLADAFALAQDRMFAELRRGERRATDLAPSQATSGHDLEGSPSPA